MVAVAECRRPRDYLGTGGLKDCIVQSATIFVINSTLSSID